jgi:hypothetical protein
MNKGLLNSVLIVFIFACVFVACEKKKSSGITPDYKQNSGTGGNPNQNNPTVTGTSTLTNPATQNTSLLVGGTGWSNPTCPSTNSLTLKGVNGETQVTLNFASAIVAGTYTIGAVPTSTTICAMTVVNAPGQPVGLIWVGTGGQVAINITPTSINATFNSIKCTQASFIYPTVSVSGTLACAQ